MNKLYIVLNTTIIAAFLFADSSAFYAGKRLGKMGEWYHVLPGGGFLRLHESLVLPNAGSEPPRSNT